jgi:hypothetical protein
LRRPKEHDLRTKDTEGALGEGEHGVGLGASPEVGSWERFAEALGACAWVRRQMKEPEPSRGRGGGGRRGEEAVEGDEGRGGRGSAGMETAAA